MAAAGQITINAKTISYVVAVIGLIATIYGGVTTVNGYAFRIETLEMREGQVAKQIEGLNSHIIDLNKQISALTIAITKLEVLTSLDSKRSSASEAPTGGI